MRIFLRIVKGILPLAFCFVGLGHAQFVTNTPAGSIIDLRVYSMASNQVTVRSNVDTSNIVASNFGGSFLKVGADKSNQLTMSIIRFTNTIKNSGNHTETFRLRVTGARSNFAALKRSVWFETVAGTVISNVGPLPQNRSTNFVFSVRITNGTKPNYAEFRIAAQARAGNNTTATSYVGDYASIKYGGDIGDYAQPGYVSFVSNGSISNQNDGYIRVTLADMTPPTRAVLHLPYTNSLQNSTTVLFTWKPSVDAESGINYYRLMVDDDIGFGTPAMDTNLAFTNKTTVLAAGTYYWRVTTFNNSGLSTNSIIWRFTIDTTGPNAVTLISPPNGKWTNANPRFHWNRVTDPAGIARYEANLATNAGFGPINTIKYTNGTNWTRPLALSDAAWRWRIRARDNASNDGSWSQTNTINVDTVVPTVSVPSPANGAFSSTKNISFSWTGADSAGPHNSGISNYSIYLQTNTLASYFLVKVTNNAAFSFNFKRNGTNWWRVRAKDRAGNTNTTTVWNVVIDTNVPIPVTHYPNTIYLTNRRPVFSWSKPASSDTNRIMVSTNLFSTYLINTLNGTATNYPAAVNMREGTNWWKASTKKIGTSTWYTSSLAMFVVDRTGPSIPALSSPISGLLTNNTAPLFAWSASSDTTTYVGSGVARYEIQFGTNITFSGVTKITNAVGLSLTSGTLSDDTWYWRVRAVDNVSNRGTWSAINNLTVDATAPLAPTIYLPLSGKWTNGNPRFYWSRPTGGSAVTNFTIEISSNIGFIPINTTVNQSGTNYLRTPGLSAGNWYWRVRARDAAGNLGPNSTAANVNIDLTAPVSSVPVPADGSYSATTNVTFTWTGNDPAPFNSGITNYTVLLRTNSLTPFFVLKVTNQAQFSRVFKHNGTNWWQIRTKDRAGNTNTAAAWSIIIDTSVPVATLHYPVNILITNNRPQFSWSAATGGDTNRLQVSVNNFGGTTIDIRQLGTNYSPLIDLAEGTNKWRVLTHKIGTTTWYTSVQAWVFVDTLPPNFTTLVGPQNNALNVFTNFADFRWKALDAGVGTTNYTLEITTNWAFAGASVNLVSTNFTTNLFNANWKWRVIARDKLGHVRISSTNSFIMQSFNASVVGAIRGSDDIHQVDMSGATGYSEKLAGNVGVNLVFSLTGTVTSGSTIKVIWQANGQPVQGVNEIVATWNGTAWVAKIPASAIKDYTDQIIYYQIVADNRLIVNSGGGVNYASWGFTAGKVTEQDNGVTVLNNVIEKGVGSVSIVYKVEAEAKVQIMVYNINGELVRELVNMTKPADVHVVQWDGKNIKGEEVGRGVYFISVRINSGKETRKVMVK